MLSNVMQCHVCSVSVYACMHACTYACLYVCVYACVHVCLSVMFAMDVMYVMYACMLRNACMCECVYLMCVHACVYA